MARTKKTVTETAEQLETVKEVKAEIAEEEAAKVETVKETETVKEAAPQGGKVYTEAEIQALVASAVSRAVADMRIRETPKSERVMLLWQAPVADDNTQEFGPSGRLGRVIGPTGTLFVPHDDFPQIIDAQVRLFLERRWLIVLSGLDEDEKIAYGVNYKPNEYLDRAAFAKVAAQGEKLLEIYPQLCDGNREIVAKAYYEAWQNHDSAVNRGLTEQLDALCKRIDPAQTAFHTILEEMAAKV